MNNASEDGRSEARTLDNAPVASGTRRRCFCLSWAALLAGFLLGGAPLRADETNSVAQSLCVENGSIITNVSQVAAAFDQPGLSYPVIWPYELQGMFEGQQIWFADFDQLPEELNAIRGSCDYEFHGVKFSALALILDGVTGAVTVKYPFSDTVLLQFDPPANYQPFQRYDQELQRWLHDSGMAPMPYAELIHDNRYGFLDPPVLVLEVWLASLSDCATYESNVAADLAAELATDAAEAEYAGQGANAAPTMAEAKGGSMMMLMDNGNPCTITNEADTFSIVTVMMDEQGCTVTWQSCSDHIYGVYSTEEMSDTNVWTVQQWMWGADGTTSWADRNAAAYPARFYKVVRANPDTLNNGVPYGWAVDNGFDPLDPNLATADPDGDGQSNYAEYVAGTDPNDPTSYFHITSIMLVGNDVWVYFSSVSGKYYDLQRYDFFGGGWTNVVENIPGNGGIQGAKDIGGISGSGWYRVVVLQLTSPPPADSDYDGIPDLWMEQHFGHPTGLAADNSRATDDADGDGLINLMEYLLGTDPLVLDPPMGLWVNGGNPYTSSLTIPIQALTTNYPKVRVSTDPLMSNATLETFSSGMASYTLLDNGDGLYNLFLQYADAAGHPQGLVVSASVTLDRLAPTVDIVSPPASTVLDQAFITLQAVAADPDPVEATAARPLKIWINDVPFWNRNGTNIVVNRFPVPSGTNSFTVTIRAADEAGNTNVAARTWMVDPSGDTVAPLLSSFNIASNTLLPDVSAVWVEGAVDHGNALVTAVVSSDGGDVTTNSLNVRDLRFEGSVPLESGTNRVAFTASDAAGNATSNLFTIVRSNRYRFEITSPAFGAFATAPSTYISGYVSALFDEGLPTETNVTSVLINGVAAVLSTNVDANGNLSFTTTNAIPLGVPITGFIAGPGIPTDPPPDPPAMSQEYEVLAKTRVEDSIAKAGEGQGVFRGTYTCGNSWFVWVENDVATNEFDLAGGDSVSVNTFEKSRQALGCTSDPANDPSIWGSWSGFQYMDTYQEPVKSLSFGYSPPRGSSWPSSDEGWAYYNCGGNFEGLGPWENKTVASLTFQAPRQYDTNTTVIFTFEGVNYARPAGVPLDLSKVKYQGQDPVAYSNEIGSVSYLLTMNRDKQYTINQDSFDWPNVTTNSIRIHPECTEYFSDTLHHLSWTNFHNKLPVRIMWNGVDITDSTTNTVIVGQRVNLQAVVDPPGIATSNFTWTIAGSAISNYIVASDSSSAQMLPLTQTNNATISYYWVSGGQQNVMCTVILTNGIKAIGQAGFNVERPAATITTTTGSVNIDSSWGNLQMNFGSPSVPGITFSSTVSLPAGFSGSIQWVQLVDTLRRREWNSGLWQRQAGLALDTTYPYETNASADDSPGSGLTDDYLRKIVDESFQMWLMFKPSVSTGSVWVPLKVVNWYWLGDATRTTNSTWNLGSSSHSVNPPASDTIAYPTWNQNVTTIGWTNE